MNSQSIHSLRNYALRSTLVSWPDACITGLGSSKFLESSFGSKKKLPLCHYFKQFKDVSWSKSSWHWTTPMIFFSFGVRLTF